MSIPMAACWATKTSSPRSTSAAPITKRWVSAPALWISSYAEAGGRFAALAAVVHPGIGGLDMPGPARVVEQRCGQTVLRQPLFQHRQSLGVACQRHRLGFELSLRLRHQLGQADGMQQAGGNPPGPGGAAQGED